MWKYFFGMHNQIPTSNDHSVFFLEHNSESCFLVPYCILACPPQLII